MDLDRQNRMQVPSSALRITQSHMHIVIIEILRITVVRGIVPLSPQYSCTSTTSTRDTGTTTMFSGSELNRTGVYL